MSRPKIPNETLTDEMHHLANELGKIGNNLNKVEP